MTRVRRDESIRKLTKDERAKECLSIIESTLRKYNCAIINHPTFIADPHGGFRIGVTAPQIIAKLWDDPEES